MSEFLNHLASRHFGFTPAIRPRLAALFEPVHWTDTQFLGFTQQAGFHEPPFSREMKGQAFHTDESSIHTSVVALPAQNETRTESTELHVELLSPHSPLEVGTAQPLLPRHQNLRAAPSGLDLGTQTQDDPAVSQPSSGESGSIGELARPSAATAAEVRSNLTELPLTREFSPTSANSLPAALSERFPVRIAKSRALLPFPSSRGDGVVRPDTTKAHTQGVFALGKAEHAAERKIDREPAIQVTIGKIEVRATTPNVTSGPVDRRPSAAMSLDEYLRQRTKRGSQ